MLRFDVTAVFCFSLQMSRPGLLDTQDLLAGAVPARSRVRVHVTQHCQRFPRSVVIECALFSCLRWVCVCVCECVVIQSSTCFRRFSFICLPNVYLVSNLFTLVKDLIVGIKKCYKRQDVLRLFMS